MLCQLSYRGPPLGGGHCSPGARKPLSHAERWTRPIIGCVSDEDWRVEVELDDERHGYPLLERLRALDLDDEARRRLGSRVVVTRDGSKVFLYTTGEDDAKQAAEVVRELARADRVTAEIEVTRWHPVEEAWKDISVPLPRTEAERERERRAAEAEGLDDWHVHVRAPDRDAAAGLEQRLREGGLLVERRWRYVTIGASSEEQADEIASRVRSELPDAELEIEPVVELPAPLFVMIRSWL
jgi:hypothetical protein